MDSTSFANGWSSIPIDEAQEHFDRGMNNSLYFLVFYALAEGLVFLWAMHRVRDFNEDFNLLSELKRYAIFWLLFTYLALWLIIQGSYGGFLSLV